MLHKLRARASSNHIHTYSFTYLLHGAEPWEFNWFSASQEIPCVLWIPKVHYCVHNCPPPVPILSQLNPVPTPTSHFLKIHLNIILPSLPESPKWSLSLSCPTKTLFRPLLSPIHIICVALLILLYFITHKILGEEYRSLSSSWCISCQFAGCFYKWTWSIQAPNIPHTKVSVQVWGLLYECNNIGFYGEELTPRPTPKLEDHPLSAVREFLFSIFTTTFHIKGHSSICNLRTRHAVVTGTHLSRSCHHIILPNLISVGQQIYIKYRVIHKSLWNFRTRLRNNQERQGRKEHISR